VAAPDPAFHWRSRGQGRPSHGVGDGRARIRTAHRDELRYDRIINVYLALIYDREIRGEDERAMACHDELLERLIEKGYPPYRREFSRWTPSRRPELLTKIFCSP
jgi:hypothetical protein